MGNMSELYGVFFSETIIIFIQSFGNPVVDILFKVITTTGSQPIYFILGSLIFWCQSRKTGIRIMYVTFFSAMITISAKNFFSMPRPPEYLHKVGADGYGFPSGHALITSGFWGYLICTTKNRVLIIIGLSAIFLISMSRVYLGVHYIGDVIGGSLIGILIAIAIFKIETRLVWIWRSLGMTSRFFLILLLTLAGLFLSGPFPESYEAGFIIFGAGAGFVLEQEKIRFKDIKSKRVKIQRGVFGVIMLGIIWLVMSVIPAFELLRYAVLGFTSTFAAPWIFSWMEKKHEMHSKPFLI